MSDPDTTMGLYTVVYVADDHTASCYGVFEEKKEAAHWARRLDLSLEPVRESMPGTQHNAWICEIQKIDLWGWPE